jgi:hypothetical protein
MIGTPMSSTPEIRLLAAVAKIVRDNVTLSDEDRATLDRHLRGVWRMLREPSDIPVHKPVPTSAEADHGYGYDPEAQR